MNLIKDIINHEKEVEESKIALSQQGDFNMMDAFQIFDTQNKGYITAPELKDNLEMYGLYSHKDDIAAFVRKYDHDSDGRILYSVFCDAFTPRDGHYAS